MLPVPGLDQFLRDYPLMAVRPHRGDALRLKGRFTFSATSTSRGTITDEFDLQILIPSGFPHDLPQITEVSGRIPRIANFHIYSDGTLCLGSPLRLLLKLSNDPTLTGFAANCLVPYLYAISYKVNFQGPLPFDELAHGSLGILTDTAELFHLQTVEQARAVLELLTLKKRRANKNLCPCGCGRRLGKCLFNFKLHPLRKLASRSWFRSLLQNS
jgi:hypothetical protein